MKSNCEIRIGACYAFIRKGHPWYGCEVAVIAKTERGFKVALAKSVCEALLEKQGGKKRKLKTFVAKESELL